MSTYEYNVATGDKKIAKNTGTVNYYYDTYVESSNSNNNNIKPARPSKSFIKISSEATFVVPQDNSPYDQSSAFSPTDTMKQSTTRDSTTQTTKVKDSKNRVSTNVETNNTYGNNSIAKVGSGSVVNFF